MESQQTSVYKRGADDGFILGIYLSVWILAVCYTLYYPIMSWVSFVLSCGVPVLLYVMLRRSYVRDFGLSAFSFLWLQGIISFVCGTLMMAAVGFIFMRFIKPEFLPELVTYVADIYEQSPSAEARTIGENMHKMVELRALPQPIYVVIEMMLFGIFSGSMLSMLVTGLVRLRKVKTTLDNVND